MTTLTYEQQTIIGTSVGVAANNAATIIAATLDTSANLDDTKYVVGAYADLVKDFTTVIIAQRGEAAGLLGLTEAFPGSQLQIEQPSAIPPQQTNVIPMPTQAAAPPVQPPAQPQVVQGSGDGDPVVEGLWRQFFADPTAWYDNRFNKKNPKAPDFKAKSIPAPDNPAFKAGLWINDTKKNPSWVPAALQQAGY